MEGQNWFETTACRAGQMEAGAAAAAVGNLA